MNNVDVSRLPQPIIDDHPDWVELYFKAWELAARSIRQSKQGHAYMDAAWDREVNYQWVWDTCFMCMYCRYAPDQYPGVQSLDNFYDLQSDDGYIGMTYDLDSGEEPWPDRINPPLFAWAEWEYYQTTGDASRLPHAIGHIERLMNWIDANRRNELHRSRHQATLDYSLYYFEDAGSSGLDDSPRTPRIHAAGQYFDWIDLSCQVAHSFRLLGRMQGVLGHADVAAAWEHRATELGDLINQELWCPTTRFYHDRMIPTNFVASKTAAGFWPLLAGFCPPQRVEALVEHLNDPREFNRPTPVPSLAADDPNYCPQGTYWTGGVWAPTNYMITRGLMQSGCGNMAHEIAVRYLRSLAATYRNHEPHTLWECYAPEADAPGLAAYTGERVKPDFVGWTGLGPIAMLIENILGVDVHAPESHVEWTIRLVGKHGLENLRVGESRQVSLVCEARANVADPALVHITSEGALTIILHRGQESKTVQVSPRQPVAVQV